LINVSQISCLGGPPDFPKGVNLKRLHVPVEDLPFVDLLCHFEETNAFITQALEKPDAVVLVHCLMVRLAS
jgi:protein-tyrosine phosphatase